MEDIDVEYNTYSFEEAGDEDWDFLVDGTFAGNQDDYDIFDSGEFKPNIKNRGTFIPSHLSMPITADDTDFLLKYDTFYCKRHNDIKATMNRLNITRHIYDAGKNDPYPLIYNFIQTTTLDREAERVNFRNNLDNALDSTYIHKFNLLQTSLTPEIKAGLELERDERRRILHDKSHLIWESYLSMKRVEIIKDQICFKRLPFGKFIEFDNLFIERDIFLLKIGEEWVVGPTSLFICVLDIYQSRFIKHLYWLLSDLENKYPTSMFDTGEKLIKSFEYLRSKLNQEFFKFISTWESLVLGHIINDAEKDLGFSSLYLTSEEEMIKILQDYGVEFDLQNLLPDRDNTDTCKMYIELLGNTKHFGHPYLEVKSGFDNVREHGTEPVFVDLEVVKLSVAIMRRDFCKNYIIKRKRWPNCKTVPKELQKAYKQGVYPAKYEHSLDIWHLLVFDKVFEYDYSPDTTELIKDSSAAEEMPNWYAEYDNCAFMHLYGKRKPRVDYSRKSTRVMQRFLTGEEFEVEKKIFELDNNYFDPKDNTACLCRKEQELKPNGRLFVKQPYEQRLAQTSMENNIAKQYMKYVPEQTMTIGEVQLMRRLAEAAKGQKQERLEIFNLDLTKWNMKFRHALVEPFGAVLDELFGMKNLYKNNHTWFILSQVFCNSRLAPPDYDQDLNPIVGDYFYNNHLGGMEGMRQKLWTIITICLIKLSAEQVNLDINIMCQGDNQVVMVSYPTNERVRKVELRGKLLDRLENVLQSVNLKLKREETWFSTRLCEFGKVRYLDGEAISNGDKKINRCIPDINDGICSIMSSLSTINTITEATAKYDYQPDVSFIINQFSIQNYLTRKGIIDYNRLNKYEAMSFLYHPTDLGGISLSSYFSHMIRGYDDKLTLWLSLLGTLKSEMPHVYNYTKRLNIFVPKSTVDYSKLVEDIFSLNIRSLPSVERKLKNLALSYIRSKNVTNPEVTKIFTSEAVKTKEYIVSRLITMKPYIPSLAHETLRNANVGILLALRNQFSSVSTINKLIQDLPPEYLRKITSDIHSENPVECFDFLKIAKDNNDKVVEILKRRIKGRSSEEGEKYLNIPCPTMASETLRKDHWKMEILGASKSYPPCQFAIKPLDKCTHDELDNSILITLSQEYSEVTSLNYLKDGPYQSYLGSATQEKVRKPSLEIAAKTSFTKAVQQLKLMESWAIRTGSPNLRELIQELLDEKVDVIPSELLEIDMDDWCAVNWGGNILHRFRSIIEKDSAIINFLTTVGTHIKQSTNNLAGITSGGRDFTIHFQLALITNIARISLIKKYTNLGVPQFCSILFCNTCTKEVTVVNFDIDPVSHPTTSTKGDSKLTIKEKTPSAEVHFTRGELVLAVSTHLGRSFGSACDATFQQVYVNDKVLGTVKPTQEVNQISINDLRYVDWESFIPALVSSSKILKNMLYRYDDVKTALQKSVIFTPLCSFLSDGKLLEGFFDFLGVEISEHYQSLDSKAISTGLFFYLRKWILDNFSSVAELLIKPIFKDDDKKKIISNQKWVLGMSIRHKFIIKHDIKLTEDRMRYNQSEISKLLNLDSTIDVSRTMIEDQAILFLRRGVLTGVISLETKTPNPAVDNVPSLTINNSSFLNLLLNYYSSMETINTGELAFKDLHHIMRPHGIISTAINKIEEILLMLNINKQNFSNIYCLAEGSGSIIEGLGCIYPNSNLFYNTLMRPDIDMRTGADQDYPPCILTSKTVHLSRLRPEFNLSKGETDITKEEFLNKFDSALLVHPADIVTMDAESSRGGDNMIIILKHLPILTDRRTKVFIYKDFSRNDAVIDLSVFKEIYEDYAFFLIKPSSSNLNNSEIYFVGVLEEFLKSTLSEQQLSLVYEIERLSLSLINENKVSTLSALIRQVNFAKERNRLLSLIFPMVSVPSDVLTKMSLNSCGIYCNKLIGQLVLLIVELNGFDHDDNTLYPIIRTMGINNLIERLSYYLIVLEVIRNDNSLNSALSRLYVDISDIDIRTGAKTEPKITMDSFCDLKSVLRTIIKNEISPCHCTFPIKDKEIFKIPLLKRVSRKISQILGKRYFLDTRFP
nr:TPA_asm: RdRp [Diachasmavirus michiganense]